MNMKEEVIRILETIIHPETGKNIIESGFLKHFDFSNNTIQVEIQTTRKNDPFRNKLKLQIEQSIKNILGSQYKIVVEFITNSVERKSRLEIFIENTTNIIAVSSGKGGVGKSTVAANIAVSLARKGFKTALIDADIFGPSIPKMFAVENVQPEMLQENGQNFILPIEKFSVKLMSIGFFVKPSDATVWRGPMASSVLKQLIEDTSWGSLDYVIIDTPPGTSDIHLSLVQTLPITGALIVSTPQQVALADTIKGIHMYRSEKINVSILGLVENMAWFSPAELPNNKYYIFGKNGCADLAKSENIDLLAQIPIIQSVCETSDSGNPLSMDESTEIFTIFDSLTNKLIEAIKKRTEQDAPAKTVKITHK
jgi:ATP-binding protein involved in chromosome partitioning